MPNLLHVQRPANAEHFLQGRSAADDLVNRALELRPVRGSGDIERRASSGYDGHDIARSDHCADDSLYERARPRRLSKVEVKIIDCDQQRAAGRWLALHAAGCHCDEAQGKRGERSVHTRKTFEGGFWPIGVVPV